MRSALLLASSLVLVTVGAIGWLALSRDHATTPADTPATTAPACDPLTRYLILWESPEQSPAPRSGRVDAYLPAAVGHAWMNVSLGSHALADWSLVLWSPDGRLLHEAGEQAATAPDHVESKALGPLEAGMYRLTWKQSGVIDGLRAEVVVRGCPSESFGAAGTCEVAGTEDTLPLGLDAPAVDTNSGGNE
jgi:hypothetical protein